MPLSIPPSVRQVFGDEAAEDFARWFDASLQERAVPRDEYREVLSRLDVLEHRMNTLEEGQAEQRRELLAFRQEVNERFDRMNTQTNSRFDQLNARFDQMHEGMRRQTRWTVGAIVIIGAILAALLSIAEFAA